MKVEIGKDGTGMAWVSTCETLYEDGRNLVAGPASNKENVMFSTIMEMGRIIEAQRREIKKLK